MAVLTREVHAGDGALRTKSVLVPLLSLPVESRLALINGTIKVVSGEAKKDMPGVDFISRDMLPTDLGETNNVWADQTGTTNNAFENSIIAAQSIANERFVGIYGVHDTSVIQAVAAVRFTIAGSIVAQWSLFNIITDDNRAESRTGYSLTPIVAKQNQSMTIDSYVRQTRASTELQYLGVVVEKVGKVINL